MLIIFFGRDNQYLTPALFLSNNLSLWLASARLTTSLQGHPALSADWLQQRQQGCDSKKQLFQVERWGWKEPNEVLLLMRLGPIPPGLSGGSNHRYAHRSASSHFHSSSEDSASNIEILLKHCSNTAGVQALNFSLFPSGWIRIHEYQNAWLKTCGEDFFRFRAGVK